MATKMITVKNDGPHKSDKKLKAPRFRNFFISHKWDKYAC